MFLRNAGRWAWLIALFISAASAQERIQLCAACHGDGGNSVNPEVPSIAGQPKLFIENQLVIFREELRRSDQMLPVVKGLKDADIVKLAEHFSKLPAKSMESAPADPALVRQAQAKAKELRCGICHLSDYSGQNQVPRLAAQRELYLEREMRAYRDGKRSGGDTIMAAALYGVSDADIKALAHFLSRVSPRGDASPAPARSARKGPSAAPK
ncbi:MAG TPA: c-type cytochrome [Burkholderiales bacterium]|nr:c-type cytochrome [Burkholderiales bacterium]